MATPDELRTAIAEGRAVFRETLANFAGDWERKPEAGEGEDAWSPRQAAQHAIGAEAYFTTSICKACGYPGVEFPRPDYATPADALRAFEEVVELTNKKLKYVTDTDLAHKDERFGTVEDLMKVNAQHLHDHAAQIRSAPGTA